MWPSIDKLTTDVYDLQFGTNVLGIYPAGRKQAFVKRGADYPVLFSQGHFYLTKLLLPILAEGAKSSPDGKARVITTSSIMRHFTSGVNYKTLKDGPERRSMGTRGLYNQSKFVSHIVGADSG